MSKRTLYLIFGAIILGLIAYLSYKNDKTNEPEELEPEELEPEELEPEEREPEETEPEVKPEPKARKPKNLNILKDEPIQKETGSEAGTEDVKPAE